MDALKKDEYGKNRVKKIDTNSKEKFIEEQNQKNKLTHEAMTNPKVGDRFEEFYHHWVFIVKVTEDHVWTLSASNPCKFPEDGKLEIRSKEEFKNFYSYKSPQMVDRYWISLVDRDNDVRGWI